MMRLRAMRQCRRRRSAERRLSVRTRRTTPTRPCPVTLAPFPQQQDTAESMTLERINPADLATPETYSHVIVATGRRLVFVAGQVAEDRQGKLVGPGDLALQARQAFDNV